MSSDKLPLAPQIPGHADQYSLTIPSGVGRVSRVSPLQGYFDYIQAVPQQPDASAGHDDRGSSLTTIPHPCINSMYPAQPSGPSLAVRPVRTVSSFTGHPYPQFRARHAAADHVPSHHDHHHASSQHPFFSQHFVPAPASGPVSHSSVVVPAMESSSQSYLHSTYNVTSPEWTEQPASEILRQSPYSQVAQADVEYALNRYPNKPCFYQCRYDLYGKPCGQCIVGDRRRILHHLRDYHDLPSGPASCLWENCTHPQPMRQENLSRHVVSHLGVKWKCPHCRVLFSRDDAVRRHIERVLPGVVVPEVDVVPGRGARSFNEL